MNPVQFTDNRVPIRGLIGHRCADGIPCVACALEEKDLEIATLKTKTDIAECDRDAMRCDRDALANSASMLAREAMPFFEGRAKKHPSHDTGEILTAARYAVERNGIPKDGYASYWIDEMRKDRDTLRSKLESANDDVLALYHALRASRCLCTTYLDNTGEEVESECHRCKVIARPTVLALVKEQGECNERERERRRQRRKTR